LKGEREQKGREIAENGMVGVVRNTTFVKEKHTENFTALKIHMECPLVLVVIAGWKQGKGVG
jgi:hypothetical protein